MAQAQILSFPGKVRGTGFDVSSGSALPLEKQSVSAKTSATFDQQFGSLGSPSYNPDAIVGLPLLIKAVSNIYERCQKDNWDGDGATAIPLAAYMQALRLISQLPTDLPLPSAHPDSDGYIEFEWYRAGKTLSILIGARPLLFWAGYYSDDKRRSGREPFEGVFPADLVSEVKKIYA